LIHPKLQNDVHHAPRTTSQAAAPPSGASLSGLYAGIGPSATSSALCFSFSARVSEGLAVLWVDMSQADRDEGTKPIGALKERNVK